MRPEEIKRTARECYDIFLRTTGLPATSGALTDFLVDVLVRHQSLSQDSIESIIEDAGIATEHFVNEVSP